MTDSEAVIAAAILHDAVKDTNSTIEDIRRKFGDEVADSVSSESEKQA